MSHFSISDFHKLVDVIDNEYAGNLNNPEIDARYGLIELKYKTKVDQNISPFSDKYYNQQVALYEEISGRKLNQWDGELHPVDLSSLIAAPNPLGIYDSSHVSEHVRALSSMLAISDLKNSPKILDMGAGHGLSSEVFAFSGCQVHAIDIDPALAELSHTRSVARNLGIVRSNLNFDDLSVIPDHSYSAAYFFQSLHHCLRPWKLIESLKEKLTKGGVIAFTGEPVQSLWWKDWGIRLDKESLYVARKYGWFESGWSSQFISECFERSGMTLRFFMGGHGGGYIGVASESSEKLDAVTEKANSIGCSPAVLLAEGTVSPARSEYFSQIGVRDVLLGLPGFKTGASHAGGFLSYGPYMKLSSGNYRLSFALERSTFIALESFVVVDIVSRRGAEVHLSEEVHLGPASNHQIFDREFALSQDETDVEARIRVVGYDGWACSYPQLSVA